MDRRFDGGWQSRPQQPPPKYSPPPNYPPQRHYVYAQNYAPWNGLAIVSFIAALCWFFWIGSLVAIVCGHIAYNATRDLRTARGNGLALTGLIFGYLQIAVAVLLIVAVFNGATQ
ncbi:DUF4190 domain-containing protein [Actinomycetospora lutea]|uniref:DUF4190 domain-containing protein n=1 Tax=Actinomycetospora lutea TaxID=663604 RepID=UPI003B678384